MCTCVYVCMQRLKDNQPADKVRMYVCMYGWMDLCRDSRERTLTYITAILIIIDSRYHDFNGFPVANWYWKTVEIMITGVNYYENGSTYMHTYIHTYIGIHTYIHTYRYAWSS